MREKCWPLLSKNHAGWAMGTGALRLRFSALFHTYPISPAANRVTDGVRKWLRTKIPLKCDVSGGSVRSDFPVLIVQGVRAAEFERTLRAHELTRRAATEQRWIPN